MENYFESIYKKSNQNNDDGKIAKHQLNAILLFEKYKEGFIERFSELYNEICGKPSWRVEHLNYVITEMFSADILLMIRKDYQLTKERKENYIETTVIIDDKNRLVLHEENLEAYIHSFFDNFEALLNFFRFRNFDYSDETIKHYGEMEDREEGFYFYRYYEELKIEMEQTENKKRENVKEKIKLLTKNNSTIAINKNYFGKISKERAKIYLRALDMTKKKYTESQAFDIMADEDKSLDALKLKKAFNKLKNEKFRNDPEGLYNYLKERSKSR